MFNCSTKHSLLFVGYYKMKIFFLGFVCWFCVVGVNGEKESQFSSTKDSHRNYVLQNLLPNETYCGIQHTDKFFYNTTNTSVYEFPWLLRIYYNSTYRICTKFIKDPYRTPFFPTTPRPELCLNYDTFQDTNNCVGVLISDRYALTAGQCSTSNSMWVIVGQYEEFKKVGCMKTTQGDCCSDPAFTVNVTEQIPFPDFIEESFLLLRLEETVKFTDFVRPICLPIGEYVKAGFGDTVVTSGFGQIASRKKQRIVHTVKNDDGCSSSRFPLKTICMKPQNENDRVCYFDRGGPIMHKRGTKNWYVEGVLDPDDSSCISHNVLGKRITPEVVDWILENMKD